MRRYSINLPRLEKAGKLDSALEDFGIRSLEDLYVSVGYGRIFAMDVVRALVPKEKIAEMEPESSNKKDEPDNFLTRVFKSARKKSETKNAIRVENIDDVLIRFAKCCNPLPGDPIVGFITRGRGVTIHNVTCQKALDTDPNRRVDVNWNIKNIESVRRMVKIRVLSLDEPGLLGIMSQTISGSGVNISYASARTTRDRKAISHFDIEVTDVVQLDRVIRSLEALKGVISVERFRS